MKDDQTISRRDWFRLSKPQSQASPQSNSKSNSLGESPRGMRDIEQPVNHDGMDLSELPPMREALLSEDDVRQLFSDIAALGSQILLMQRPSGASRASASKFTTADQLKAAQDSLLSGAIPRLQIRYHWKSQNWIDTLQRREAAIHLIRIAHLSKPSGR